MKIDLYRTDDRFWHRCREVEAVPAVGQEVVWHVSDHELSEHFEIISVLHVFEDRAWYVEHKDIGGDRIAVTLKPIPGPKANLDAWIKSATENCHNDPENRANAIETQVQT